MTDAWTVGTTGVAATGQYLFGDEANLTKQLPGYFVLNLNTSYQVTPNIQLFGLVQNVLDAKYYVYGTFSPTLLHLPSCRRPAPPIRAATTLLPRSLVSVEFA